MPALLLPLLLLLVLLVPVLLLLLLLLRLAACGCALELFTVLTAARLLSELPLAAALVLLTGLVKSGLRFAVNVPHLTRFFHMPRP